MLHGQILISGSPKTCKFTQPLGTLYYATWNTITMMVIWLTYTYYQKKMDK